MKFLIKISKFIKLLSKFNSCISVNNKNPILSNVLLELKNNILLFTITNLDTEISYSLYLNSKYIFKEGMVTVNIRKLYDLCKTFNSKDKILVKLYNKYIKIKFLDINLSLVTLPIKDFPLLNKHNFYFIYKIGIYNYLLKKIIYSIYFSIGNNDLHNCVNGMLIEYYNGYFFFVTSDSYRMSIYKVSDKLINCYNIKENFFFILSNKLVLELFKFLDLIDDNEIVFMNINKTLIKINFNNFIIYSGLLNGIFPDYKRLLLITKDFYTLKFDILKLKSSLTRSCIISSYSFNYVTLIFYKNILSIYSNNTFSDEIKENIKINYNGKKVIISLNVKFILDILSIIKDSNEINLCFKNKNSIFKINYNNNKNLSYMIMPIKL